MRVEDKPKQPELRTGVHAPPAGRARSARWKRRYNLLSFRIAATQALDRFRAEPFHPLLAEQDRWFIWLPIGLALGVTLYFSLPSEPMLPALALSAMLSAAVAWRVRDAPVAFAFAAFIATIVAGAALASYEAQRVYRPAIGYKTGPVTLWGQVREVEKRDANAVRYTVRLQSIRGYASETTPDLVTITRRGAGEPLAPGQWIRVRAILMPPPEAAAPGAFDFARRAYFDRLGAVGFALGQPGIIPAPTDGTMLAKIQTGVERLRSNAAERIRRALPGDEGEVAAALIVGKRGGIADDTTDSLRSAGLQHILAISGLHMALVSGSVFLAMRTLLAAIPGLALTRPIRKYAAVAALLAACAYLVISGASISAQRAFIMAFVMFTAVLLDRPALTLRNVALAAIVLIAMKPSAVMEAGFQMSFAATAALVSVYETLRWRRLRRGETEAPYGGGWSRLRFAAGAIVLTALVGGIATAPFAAFHFNRIAPYGLLGNVLAMPVVSFLVMPAGVFSGLALPFGMEAWPLQAMGAGIGVVTRISHWVAGLPQANHTFASFGPFALFVITAGLYWGVIWRGAWRYPVAISAVAAGIVLAAAERVPDILIDRDGGLAAVRNAGGQLIFAAKRKSSYVIETWLRRSGDQRPEEDVLNDISRCKAASCRVTADVAAGLPVTVAVQMKDEAVEMVCAGADIAIVTALAVTREDCPAGLVITPDMLEARGALAINVDRQRDGRPAFAVTGANDHRRWRIWHRPASPAG
ncbi:MAG: ComEC/Rec2 family competence protein [Rhodobiaceae bacterium]|nr:ComEC/Rec2 family competence protein [Rhodobiaceae bacterium]